MSNNNIETITSQNGSPTITPVSEPFAVGGDPISSSICTKPSCGTSSETECSGGYGCDESDISFNDTNIIWSPNTPKPDDTTKIPKKCNIPKHNNGKDNIDPFKPLDPEDIIKDTTEGWKVEINVTPPKPVIIESKL